MTRLEKYLLAAASDIIDAESSESRYFSIGNIKLRMSDHYSKNTDADIQVIVPYNGGTKYFVTIKESEGRMLCWNSKQIQDFIPALQTIKGLKTPALTVKEKSETKLPAEIKVQRAVFGSDLSDAPELTFKGLIKTRLKQNKLGAYGRVVLMRSKSAWTKPEIDTLPGMLGRDLNLPDACKVNEDVRIFLSCTSLTYEEMLNIYKIVVVDNKLIPTIKILQKAYTLINTPAE